jgi:peptidoglycan/LPS O-acetylase OafA/YrhL
MTAAVQRPRYIALDAMRGVAALLVVVFHAARLLDGRWAPGGYLAVDLFFVLSGFVIAAAYDKRIVGGMSARRFTLIRTIRFWPLYALGLALGLAHQLMLIATHNPHAMGSAHLAAAVPLNLVFLPDFAGAPGNLFPLNSPSWSLFFELLVNIAYVVAFPWLGRRALGAVALTSGAIFAWLCWQHGTADLGSTFASAPAGVPRTLFSFSMGLLIFRSGWRPFTAPLWILLPAVALLMLAPVPSDWRAVYDIGFVLLLSPLLVLAGARSQRASRAADWLGRLSYPLYAVHYPLLMLGTPLAEKLHLPFAVRVVLVVIGLPALALLLDRMFDQPVVKAMQKWLERRAEPPLPGATLP